LIPGVAGGHTYMVIGLRAAAGLWSSTKSSFWHPAPAVCCADRGLRPPGGADEEKLKHDGLGKKGFLTPIFHAS
jgi:hypothetical protein